MDVNFNMENEDTVCSNVKIWKIISKFEIVVTHWVLLGKDTFEQIFISILFDTSLDGSFQLYSTRPYEK